MLEADPLLDELPVAVDMSAAALEQKDAQSVGEFANMLSAAQLETVTYAGYAHSQTLPEQPGHNGGSPMNFRRGYFIPDGTASARGHGFAGIVLDNWAQGRKKALLVSESRDLIKDGRRN